MKPSLQNVPGGRNVREIRKQHPLSVQSATGTATREWDSIATHASVDKPTFIGTTPSSLEDGRMPTNTNGKICCFCFSAESRKLGKPVGMNNPVLVMANGTVRWLAPMILHSSCKLNVKYFPFDEQFCQLSFASWTYSSKQLEIEPKEMDILQNYTGILI